ncbi:MAG TPA: acyl-CoA synthetase FdrA, partial [Planctomycetota bacterium]|nr:acyl-CoA synthetase FdrA [Planctomycetota bacterium]
QLEIVYEIRKGAYYDSVMLLQLQKHLSTLEHCDDCGVVMATPLNRQILQQSGLFVPEMNQADQNDLILSVRSDTKEHGQAILDQVDVYLNKKSEAVDVDYRPKSIETAVKILPDAQWVLISLPGRYAAAIANEALDYNKHVFLYSDNVSLEDEIKLKQKAAEKGLLVMGPDCGTALVHGYALGFADQVKQGSIGIVGASGTGIQAVISRIAQKGYGITHALGTGGRDLSKEVGGITAIQSLKLLQQDPNTKVIIIISKPPCPEVAQKLLQIARNTDKPVVINFLGFSITTPQIDNLYYVSTLEQAAETSIELLNNPPTFQKPQIDTTKYAPTQKYLRGLFSGGTLAFQSLLLLRDYIPKIFTHISLPGMQKLNNLMQSQEHTVLDLGADDFTVGKLHPMMDQTTRLNRILQEAKDPETAIILLDVVLGYGAHEDPAQEIADTVQQAQKQNPNKHITYIATVIGTELDPQKLSDQIAKLQAANIHTYTDTREAISHAGQIIQALTPQIQTPKDIPIDILHEKLQAINIGLEVFSKTLITQEANTIQVEWKPPAAGKENLMTILQRMKRS